MIDNKLVYGVDMGLKEFRKHIETVAFQDGIDKDWAFLKWYKQMRAKDYAESYTGNGDGNIDLVLHGPEEIILIQGKCGKSNIGEVRSFHNTVVAWHNDNSFRRWLKDEVTNNSAKNVYRKVFQKKRRGKRLVWEFLCLNKYSGNWPEILQRETNFDTRIAFDDDILYYFSLDKIGATYVQNLKIQTTGAFLRHEGRKKYKEVNTYICVLDLDDLLKKLKENPESDVIFARNVRLEIPNSPVNADIGDTYRKQSEEFFFGNNGIHIICTKASFRAQEVELEQPAIINGGQTLRTLMKERYVRPDVTILARITEISKSSQAGRRSQHFVNKIIFRANSNNAMDPWDLRSNDEIQVKIAKELYAKGIYYERKQHEWRWEKANLPPIGMHVDSVTLAQIMAICDNQMGPVVLKKLGKRPLFRDEKEGGHYPKIFQKVLEDMDKTETMIRMYFLVYRSVGYAKNIPVVYKRFRNAAANYIIGILWRTIKDLQHPVKPQIGTSKRRSKIENIIADMTTQMFLLFKKDMKRGVKQNDIFRTEKYWDKARRKFLTQAIKRSIIRGLRRS